MIVEDPRGDHEFPFINIFDRESVICAERHGIQLERFEAKDTRWQSFEPLTGKFPEWKGNGVCIYTRSPRTLAWIEQMMLLTGVAPGKEFEPGVERTPPRFTRRETTILGFAG